MQILKETNQRDQLARRRLRVRGGTAIMTDKNKYVKKDYIEGLYIGAYSPTYLRHVYMHV